MKPDEIVEMANKLSNEDLFYLIYIVAGRLNDDEMLTIAERCFNQENNTPH